MLRLSLYDKTLKYNTQLLLIDDHPEDFYEITELDIADVQKSDQLVDQQLQKIVPKTVYTDFINEIKLIDYRSIPGQQLVIYDENIRTFYILLNDMNVGYFRIRFAYTPENDIMLQLTKDIFRIDSNRNFRIFDANPGNRYSFIGPWQILELIYAKYDVESYGEKPFTKFYKPKKTGGMREIIAPNPKIKAALQHLNTILQAVYDSRNSNFQVAYKKTKNVKTGATIHTQHKYVYNIDLHDFYPSCKKELVKKYTDFLFAHAYNREFLEKEFFDVILINDGLFIGSPISGTLANAIISKPVAYMNNLCKRTGMYLSVYADDISFSSDKFIAKEYVMNLFTVAFSKYSLESYFTINEKKSVGFSGCHRKVTGVSINGNDQVTVSRKYYRALRVQIDHLARDIDTGKIDIRALQGKIAYATMLDDSGKVYRYLKLHEKTIHKYNLCSSEKMEELKNKFEVGA